MKFSITIRRLLFLTVMSFYASCGREDIFEDRRDLMALTSHEAYIHNNHEGERNG